MTSVRAKLYVASVERSANAPDAVKVRLGAVTRGDANKTWAEATPSASFEMTIQNPAAAALFVQGEEFYVDFTPTGEFESLATPHDYEPSEHEAKNGDRYGNGRCVRCNCKRPSHDEPLRSQLVRTAGLSPG